MVNFATLRWFSQIAIYYAITYRYKNILYVKTYTYAKTNTCEAFFLLKINLTKKHDKTKYLRMTSKCYVAIFSSQNWFFNDVSYFFFVISMDIDFKRWWGTGVGLELLCWLTGFRACRKKTRHVRIQIRWLNTIWLNRIPSDEIKSKNWDRKFMPIIKMCLQLLFIIIIIVFFFNLNMWSFLMTLGR